MEYLLFDLCWCGIGRDVKSFVVVWHAMVISVGSALVEVLYEERIAEGW